MKLAIQVADQAERAAAIDPNRSFIVQAPAGSGKTELLIQRFLALLAQVERPQQILAITFTRKAAAEMRGRLLEALDASHADCPQEEHKKLTWSLAKAALAQDQKLAWDLRENPTLLQVQTIDSFNAGLVSRMPWLSRFGGIPELAEDAEPLYLKATESLLSRLERQQPGTEQLTILLSHLDNRVERLQQMLVEMLRKRDQWLRHLIGIKGNDSRRLLEDGLKQLVTDCLHDLSESLPAGIEDELLFCGRYAASQLWDQGDRPLLALTDLDWMPQLEIDHLPLWQGFADLILTGKNELRKPRGVTVKCGFPADQAGKAAKQRMQALLLGLAEQPEFIRQLIRSRELPMAHYTSEQWQVLQALIVLLPELVAELWLTFRGEGQADFAEIALKARDALMSTDHPSDLLLKLDNQLEHILVDEFQDTSWLQFQLLETLTSGWQRGDGRTLFLVGDPMQSIYRFREAEVGLFLQTFTGRLGESGPQLVPLQLRSNFRSQKGIVDWVNNSFATIFPKKVDPASGAVPLAPADSVRPRLQKTACQLHPFNGRNDSAEAETVLQLIRSAQAESPSQKVAILVRSRTHLPQILQLLRHQRISFQAQDIDFLGEQPVVLDILALARALLHRADRVAWLSVLRAPWAALSLNDLHALVAEAPYETLPRLLQDQKRLQTLSADGQQLIARIWPVLDSAINKRNRLSLRQLVEGCWLALAGPACYDQDELGNAALIFDLLETLEVGSDLLDVVQLEKGLAKLFSAPDREADASLQVMTIHKAKGLEFDQVILPGLGRQPRGTESRLLRWLEHPDIGLLLAPIAPRDGSDQDRIYRLIGRLEQEKQEYETTRLLYVAATRAKNQLHLLGHARENSQGVLKPAKGSLLETLWPVVENAFAAAAVKAPATVEVGRAVFLRRLPLNWQPPELLVASLPEQSEVKRASESALFAEEEVIYSGWENQLQRHVGTLVHNLLEQLVKRGLKFWSAVDSDFRRQSVARQLGSLGVPAAEQTEAAHIVMNAVQNTLGSEKGRWLLHDHAESVAELALTGLVEGKLTHAVIDRTFIDEQGVRWAIDYKVSAPKAGVSLSSFVQQKSEQYRSQLLIYQKLLRQVDPDRDVRMALYFPLFDGWCELH